jgi:hypothetical protein
MCSVQQNARGGAACGQRPCRETAQVLRCQLHRAHSGQLRQPDTDPRELGTNEPQIELDIVGNDHMTAQKVKQRRRDLLEPRGAGHLAGSEVISEK